MEESEVSLKVGEELCNNVESQTSKNDKSEQKENEKETGGQEEINMSDSYSNNGICRCPTKQLCICNYNAVLDALLEYDRIYDNPKPRDEVPWKPEKKASSIFSTSDTSCNCAKEEVCTCEVYMVKINFFMNYRLILSKKYSYRTELFQLKYEMSNLLKIPPESLQILRWHVFLNDCKTIEYLDPEPGKEIDLTVINTSSEIPTMIQENIVPDIITVHIENEDIFKEITVEIEDRSIPKPFLGGFKHKESDIEYHHAETQSGPRKPKVLPCCKNHRDTQTVRLRHRSVDQSYSRATQMSSEETYIPSITDRILTPGKYETADERENRSNFFGKVLIIQRYFRSWKIRRALKKLSEEYKQTVKNDLAEKNELAREFKMQKIREIAAKTFPRTRDDFAMLYSMVDRWKRAQIEQISRRCVGAARLAEFCLLLAKETEMLLSIEKHRQRVREEARDLQLMAFFREVGDPVRWTGYKGLQVSMDTLETQKGRQYKGIFYDACNHKQPPVDRLVFIKNLRDSLKDHNCATSNQLIDLLNREEELINHRVEEKSLDMLRKRIEQLLLKHMKTPECNEGVTRRMVRLQQEEFEKNSNYCPRCNRIKSNKEFPPINSRNLAIRSCMSCTWYDRVQEPWYEIAPYRLILRQIRRDERKRNNLTSIAYIIQEKDIHYIVQRIWHARSMINESTNINELRLCRWDKNEEWSPWNTILLTEKEMVCHLKVDVFTDVYDEDFRIAVMDKNILGRVVFANSLFLKNQYEKQKKIPSDSESEDNVSDS